jgi:hypothetical protein
MQHNSSRNPSVAVLDGRLSKSFAVKKSRRVEVSADVFNILNLLIHQWGIVRETSTREDVPLLNSVGWDTAHNRPVYTIPTVNDVPILPSIDKAVIDASRWRLQLGARYEF